jgi:uncharacterized damage-inducible protein DinB
MTDLAHAVVEQARNKMLVESPAMIRECLGLLDDEQVWWRPNESANSVANLVLHLCGATRHFLGRGVGGTDYVRDRDAEFAARNTMTKAELLRVLDKTLAEADWVLSEVSGERLFDMTRNIGVEMTVLSCLLRMSHHWSYHAGQIVFITKSLREGSVNDLMRRVMVK